MFSPQRNLKLPMDRSKYPVNWDEIALGVKEAAGWKCEKCGMAHMSDGTMGSCLTVHHPNCDPGNSEADLTALCARCHLKFEAILRKYGNNKNQLRLCYDTLPEMQY